MSPVTADHPHAHRRRIPSQGRSRETVDAICAAASAILAEEGIAGLTTNAVARRAGVAITAVYAYFPDKWAIVHELAERFEHRRGDDLDALFAQMDGTEDWRTLLRTIWRRMAEHRVRVPGGMALRRALGTTPVLYELDRAQSRRAAMGFAAVLRRHRPALDEATAFEVAWTSTVATGALLDDLCADGVIDEARLELGIELDTAFLARYLEPHGPDGPQD